MPPFHETVMVTFCPRLTVGGEELTVYVGAPQEFGIAKLRNAIEQITQSGRMTFLFK